MAPKNKERSGSPSRINDARFAKFESDPRYRLPSRRDAKTKLDKRFSRVLKDKEFTATTQIDRYGRKLKSDKKKKALERLYEAADDEEEDDEDSEDDTKSASSKPSKPSKMARANYDAARGGGFSASESESDEDDEDDDDESDGERFGGEDDADDSDEAAVDTQQFREEEAEVPTGEITHRLAIVNLDWDHVKARDLMAMFASFVPKNGRGRIERISVYPSQFGKERMQREELEGPPREIFKAKDSDEEEDDDEEGSKDSEDDDDSDEDDDDEDEKVKQDLLREEDDTDFDSNALRSYQLDRLRYYYAVMVCSDTATAEAIYRATDGTEYQSSSNFIDLRFVPDDTTFDDDEPRDECTEVPTNYKPVEFVTQALQHSKVKLTWDMHPEDTSRKDLMKKAFSGTPAELIENDLRAYLASDSDGEDGFEDDGEEFGGVEENGDDKEGGGGEGDDADEDEEKEKPAKLSKKELARQKMRAALGLAEEPAKKSGKDKKNGPVGGMQITFTPALSDAAAAKKKSGGADGSEETTLEKYKRKEKERKALRKQKAIAKREGRDLNADAEAESDVEEDGGRAEGGDDQDLGFNDPFFLDDAPGAFGAAGGAGASKSAIRKEERLKKRAAREAAAKEKEASRAQLEALMGDDGEEARGSAGHFDMREVMKAEKQRQKEARKKNRRNQNRRHDGEDDAGEAAGGASAAAAIHGVDVADPRLQAVFAGGEFAIDPSHPQYKDTLGLEQMQNEARRKRKGGDGEDGGGASSKSSKKAKTNSTRSDELADLVKSVKSKAKKAAL
ncbi:hypothetical protein HMPREF1624_01503 [Sporothrix schenckii ATCC 58251]|uniref:Uncharacterized protein n=1 Tax=Sporothrix schenckii (strain ATCC 58251 / de Perez 2211183) TaxID=1391915 RepID=U7Q5T1_SPOS1|nr:hypothetical protein HMPREF1624_01503 [Sporothrix schenckii ATCC 58251]